MKLILILAIALTAILPPGAQSSTVPTDKARDVRHEVETNELWNTAKRQTQRIRQRRGKTSPASAAKGRFPSDAFIRELQQELVPDPRTAGMIVGLIEPHGRRRVIAYGNSAAGGRPLDAESVMEIGSVTKAFTGALLADMVRRGEVQLEEPVKRLLPSGVRVPSKGGKEITLLDLATHTSGLPHTPGNVPNNLEGHNRYTIEQMYDFLSGYELPREPGA